MPNMDLTINEATLFLVLVILRQNGKPDATMNDATSALRKALEELADD